MKESMKRTTKKVVALGLAATLALSVSPIITADAAAKKPAISKKTLTLTVGNTKKLTVKKNGNKIKTVKWSSTKKAVAAVTQKGVVKAKKKGTAKIKAVVKTAKKKFTLTCTVKVKEAKEEEIVTDQWVTPGSPVVLEGLKDAFDRYNLQIEGASYSPFATIAYYLSTADGSTTWRVFARQTLSDAEATSKYVIVDLTETMNGDVTLKALYPTTQTAFPTEGQPGGWSECESPVIEKDVWETVYKNMINPVGVYYNPIAKIGEQVVAGVNYCILCEYSYVVENPEPGYLLLNVFVGNDGTVELGEPNIIDMGTSDEPTVRGGWQTAESPVVDNALQAILEKACEKEVGISYVPHSLLATREDDGQDFRLLCRAVPTIVGAKAKYAIVEIHANLLGEATISEVNATDIEIFGTDPAAGWAEAGPEIAKGEGKYLEDALAGLDGVDYNPVALLGTEMTRGTKYRFICEARVVVPNAVPHYAMVEVSVDNEGKATLGEITDLTNA